MPGRGMAAGALPLFRHNSSPLCPCVRPVQPVCSAVIHLNAPRRFSLQNRSFPVNPRTVRQRIKKERDGSDEENNGRRQKAPHGWRPALVCVGQHGGRPARSDCGCGACHAARAARACCRRGGFRPPSQRRVRARRTHPVGVPGGAPYGYFARPISTNTAFISA